MSTGDTLMPDLFQRRFFSLPKLSHRLDEIWNFVAIGIDFVSFKHCKLNNPTLRISIALQRNERGRVPRLPQEKVWSACPMT